MTTPTNIKEFSDAIDDIEEEHSGETDIPEELADFLKEADDVAADWFHEDNMDDEQFEDFFELTEDEQDLADEILSTIETCAENDDFTDFFTDFRNAIEDASSYEEVDPPPSNPNSIPECFTISTPFGNWCIPSIICVKKFAGVNGFRGITIGDCFNVAEVCKCKPKEISTVWIAAILAVAGLWWAAPGFSAAVLRFLAELKVRAAALGIG